MFFVDLENTEKKAKSHLPVTTGRLYLNIGAFFALEEATISCYRLGWTVIVQVPWSSGRAGSNKCPILNLPANTGYEYRQAVNERRGFIAKLDKPTGSVSSVAVISRL